MSRVVTYFERLDNTAQQVTLPDTRQDCFDWLRDIQSLEEEARRDKAAMERWKRSVRLATSSDLYMCGLFHSWWWRKDLWTGKPEVDCDFQFEYARWVQFESENVVDYTAREHGKSTWRLTRVTQEIVRDPDISIALFSFDLQKGARKHVARWKEEIEQNHQIKVAWDDVFWMDPIEEKAPWSMDHGLTVKRRIAGMPTFSAWTFMRGLPTGARFGIMIFDDCETEQTVENEDQREKVQARFRSALNLGGRGSRKWIPGTFHHNAGLLAYLIRRGWKAHCNPAEDVTQPPPDITSLYDQYKGIDPLGNKIPEEVRITRLRGKPVYLHPLECAQKRFEQTHAVYEMQSMGDPVSGQAIRFKDEWVHEDLRIKAADLRDWAIGKYGYITVDPSKGLQDPSVGLMWVTDSDGTITLVDGFRGKFNPSELEHQVYVLASSWDRTVDLQQVRVEIYGQATWDHQFRTYFQKFHYNGPIIVPIGAVWEKGKIMRAWTRLEPLFKRTKIRLPTRLMVIDENGRPYDLIEYFIEQEYKKFPVPATDDILDSMALMSEYEDVPAIEYPERIVPWARDEMDESFEQPPLAGIDGDSYLWH